MPTQWLLASLVNDVPNSQCRVNFSWTCTVHYYKSKRSCNSHFGILLFLHNTYTVFLCIVCMHVLNCFNVQMTPLHMAVEKGHAKIIPLLTGAGAELEARTDQDVSAWLVVDTWIVHTHRNRDIESVSSLSIAVSTHDPFITKII